MRRHAHENVATVLVDPAVLADLELELMGHDLRVWPVRTAPMCADGPRRAFQIRQALLDKHRGAWACAAEWVPVWIGFGKTWQRGDEPLPWAAHQRLWRLLGERAEHVRYHRRLGGVRRIPLPQEAF
ncbi:hypothetical protein [Luteipulveratus mongoliensis]|uniref:Uncharacterized protein n=1 Tax=Luteipulveratus mongoliensis TaxID=571913 RepID=A0A0K1JRE4_9MICO|nr:hypothetical protein [Luteipulveratus mongoliensis]AKU19286.1 hypothetical protein VV02_24590 [Luteipulveratus mongoliensis]